MAGILLENSGSDQERAAYARQTAGEKKKTAIENMERARALNGDVKMSMAMAIPGVIRKDTIVPAGANHYVSENPKVHTCG